jgi:hypothetical protein
MFHRRQPGFGLFGRVLAMGLLTAVVLSACSLGSDTDYTTVETGHLKVSYPKAWTDQGAGEDPWTKKVGGDGVSMQIAGKFSEDVGAYAALARLDLPATLDLPDYTPEHTDKVEVEGAYDAVVRKYSYTDKGTRHEGVWIIASQWPYPATAVVSLSGEKVDDALVAQIRDRLVFVKKEE